MTKSNYDKDKKEILNLCSKYLDLEKEEQRKENYDYDECYADFNDCVNEAEWTKQIGSEYE